MKTDNCALFLLLKSLSMFTFTSLQRLWRTKIWGIHASIFFLYYIFLTISPLFHCYLTFTLPNQPWKHPTIERKKKHFKYFVRQVSNMNNFRWFNHCKIICKYQKIRIMTMLMKHFNCFLSLVQLMNSIKNSNSSIVWVKLKTKGKEPE